MTKTQFDFSQMLNWQLMKRSHDFPGPDGGTCINEAAIVAAGFPYQAVGDVNQMPVCFSRVISQFALSLNDAMPDKERQRLLPYVARLAGTADTTEIEKQRVEFIVKSLVNRLIADMIQSVDPVIAQQCREARSLSEIAKAAEEAAAARLTGWSAAEAAALAARSEALVRAARLTGWSAAEAAAELEAAGISLNNWVWDWAVETLDGVLEIGNRADDLDLAMVRARLDAVRPKEGTEA